MMPDLAEQPTEIKSTPAVPFVPLDDDDDFSLPRTIQRWGAPEPDDDPNLVSFGALAPNPKDESGEYRQRFNYNMDRWFVEDPLEVCEATLELYNGRHQPEDEPPLPPMSKQAIRRYAKKERSHSATARLHRILRSTERMMDLLEETAMCTRDAKGKKALTGISGVRTWSGLAKIHLKTLEVLAKQTQDSIASFL